MKLFVAQQPFVGVSSISLYNRGDELVLNPWISRVVCASLNCTLAPNFTATMSEPKSENNVYCVKFGLKTLQFDGQFN